MYGYPNRVKNTSHNKTIFFTSVKKNHSFLKMSDKSISILPVEWNSSVLIKKRAKSSPSILPFKERKIKKTFDNNKFRSQVMGYRNITVDYTLNKCALTIRFK